MSSIGLLTYCLLVFVMLYFLWTSYIMLETGISWDEIKKNNFIYIINFYILWIIQLINHFSVLLLRRELASEYIRKTVYWNIDFYIINFRLICFIAVTYISVKLINKFVKQFWFLFKKHTNIGLTIGDTTYYFICPEIEAMLLWLNLSFLIFISSTVYLWILKIILCWLFNLY